MNTIFYVQYDNNQMITSITENNMYNDNTWTMVFVPDYMISYFKSNYQQIKYDVTNKALIYPDGANASASIVQNNQAQMNEIQSQIQSNQTAINSLQRRMDWNHIIQVFTLPVDLDFLNSAYGLSNKTGSTSITAFPINGVFVLPPNCGTTFTDAPSNVDYAGGLTMKVTIVSTNIAYVKIIDKNGIYGNQYTIGQSIDSDQWKTIYNAQNQTAGSINANGLQVNLGLQHPIGKVDIDELTTTGKYIMDSSNDIHGYPVSWLGASTPLILTVDGDNKGNVYQEAYTSSKTNVIRRNKINGGAWTDWQ